MTAQHAQKIATMFLSGSTVQAIHVDSGYEPLEIEGVIRHGFQQVITQLQSGGEGTVKKPEPPPIPPMPEKAPRERIVFDTGEPKK